MLKIVKNKKQLKKYFDENNIDRKILNNYFESNFTLKTPEVYLHKIDWTNTADPLQKMVIPQWQETDIKDYELLDPIGDTNHLATKNLVHRYPHKVLLLLTNDCQINCRFCFRKELEHHTSLPDINAIITYLDNNKQINEVIFSGGDPLSLSAKYLTSVFEKLSKIKHITKYRFHTRIPVVNPQHIDQSYLDLFATIAKHKLLTIVLHVNHAREIDDKNKNLFKRLEKTALLLSQTVLLKDINNNPETLSNLFEKLTLMKIKPYYLHHPDYVKGTSHFRVSIDEGKKMYMKLRGQLSGYSLPDYVLDLPGGKGKVAVLSLEKTGSNTYTVRNYKNELITYKDPIYLN